MSKKIFSTILAVMLVLSYAYGQTGSKTYDFRDGTIISKGKSDDGSLRLSGGSFKLHGATYGLNMKVGGQIKIAVTGSCTLKFLGSTYSGLNMQGKTSGAIDLGTQLTKVAKDLSDTYDFVYSGAADSLTFTTIAGTGNDLYLPSIQVIPAQAGGDAALTAALKNVIYYFDLRDGSIIPNQTSLNGNYTIIKGLFKIECGPSNAYGYNGSQHGSILKAGNKITLQVAGNSYIKIGGCQYSNGTISVSSTTGTFDKTSQAAKTAKCYDQDGSTVNFLYVGTAGTVVLDFVGTTYIPYIALTPVPYAVELNPWVQKAGTVSVNGTTINYAAGANSTANPTVTVSAGTVISATPDVASLRINLSGKKLSSYTSSVTGDVASAKIVEDSLSITFTGTNSKPAGYKFIVADNSIVAKPEAGKTYSYDLTSANVLPQIAYSSLRYKTFVMKDGIATINSNTDTEKMQFGFHDAAHGAVLFPGNSIDIMVAGNATITFGTCQYGSAKDGIFEFTDSRGNVLGSTPSNNIGTGVCGTNSFTYTGPEGIIKATLKSALYPTAEVYIHGFTVGNEAKIQVANGKTDVWDFGAEQLDNTLYNNQLNVATINSWYASTITPGSTNNVLPTTFTAGVLSWVGGSNDRLRTTNTNLTRYDANIASATGYTGRIYVNGSAATGRYLSLTLSADDEVTVVTRTDAGGNINFQYVADPAAQTDAVTLTDLTVLKFIARSAGTYHIFDNTGKPSYFRVYRKDATYMNLSGSIDVTNAAGIPANYGIIFKNGAGKTWKAIPTSGGYYTVKLPVGYDYTLSLSDANGYIISSTPSLSLTETTNGFNIVLKKVELYTVSGYIIGLGDKISGLKLIYKPNPADNKIFVPEPVFVASTGAYSVQLEPNCKYSISANGVNDFYVSNDTIKIGNANTTNNVVFGVKTRYGIGITTIGLTPQQLAKLNITFTNLNESGYVYPYNTLKLLSLRNGTYSIACSGLDEYPVALGLTSNLKVAGTYIAKTLVFNPIKSWSFDDKAIVNGTQAYNGLLFTGTVTSELAKGHLTAKPGATVKVPVSPGEKIRIGYYYTAAFSINGGDTIKTSSNSTSTFEYAEYVYQGTAPGYVTLTMGSTASTTYITDITISMVVPYKSVITVGTNKDYKTINDALKAVANMTRGASDRVTISIDPGNYEEMLVVSVPNVTLKNAAANPSIALANKGVSIDPNAVRITSYYGHGYSYYSMGNDQKWNADLLRVNKENGSLSYVNTGSGTTNGSFWNATVVISANGFVAENIIFENSFNQYISKKESEDVVVMWESGNKGLRPTDIGNTGVQRKSFVERGAAIAITNNTDKVVLTKCRVVGRQDSFYGGTGTRVVVYKGSMMGGTDYIFGGMTAVFYKSDLVMNTSDDSGDQSYLTAAQQSSGRGYLMFECNVKSATPGIETASTYQSKPGEFGRPWQATTSEVVFYNTTINTTNATGYEGKSLIAPEGWLSSLGGESKLMYEYGTIEKSGVNNLSSRASWSTLLTVPKLTDGTAISTFNFTKGTDNWDPIPALIAADIVSGVISPGSDSEIQVNAHGNNIVVSNIKSNTQISVYSLDGSLIKLVKTNADTNFDINSGLWIVKVVAPEGNKTVKMLVR